MDSLLANFDIDNKKNFWSIYPSWKTPKLFRELHKKDKSKAKCKTSDIMWSMVHMFDKSVINIYTNLDEDERIEVINEDILEQPDFDWSKYEEEISLTEKILMTEEQKELESFKKFMSRRRKLVEKEEAEITLDKLKQLDEARTRNKVNLVELERLKGLVEQSSGDTKTKGGIIESAEERGII